MKKLTRREMLTSTLTLAAGLLLLPRHLRADIPAVTVNDPMAKRLNYTEDTTTVDAATYPKHTNQQSCRNCAQFQGSSPDQPGPCLIFAGKAVKPTGWCISWKQKK